MYFAVFVKVNKLKSILAICLLCYYVCRVPGWEPAGRDDVWLDYSCSVMQWVCVCVSTNELEATVLYERTEL